MGRSRRILDVRAADLQEEMAEQRFFRFASSDEDGGNPANIAASEASNQIQRDCASSSKWAHVRAVVALPNEISGALA